MKNFKKGIVSLKKKFKLKNT